ncbi:NAC064 [Hirschfeldia incana]|nr:NAC064 [Hirschfeldia incana]
MTPQRNKRRETQQPSPQHDPPNMQFSSSSSASYPPGYRFVPTDAELIDYYLKPFSRDNSISWPNIPIHHANIYESNPQQLTAEYKKGNLTERFFISERTKIKRNGTKQKRGDHNGGHWHAKAVTKTIKAKQQGVVGYKTTLNYYVGKQPTGVRTKWLMKEYWLESSDHNNTVDYAICKIYLKPTAKKDMNEEDVEDLEEEIVQPSNAENQQPQPQCWQPELNSHQPQRHDIAYQEPLQPQPLDTITHHQSHNTESECQELHQQQPLEYTIHHQPQRHDNAYQEPPQPQPLDTSIPHQSQRHGFAYQEPPQPRPLVHQAQFWQATHRSHQTQPHEIAYHEPHQPQPIETVQNQLPQFWSTPSDSYPPHCQDIQYPQPQPLDAIEYQYLYQSGPLTTYKNMIESSTQQNSNGDIRKVDHALKIHLTPKGTKREAEEEEDEKRKRKKKEEGEEGVEAPKELEQLINSHQNSDDDDSFYKASLIHTY